MTTTGCEFRRIKIDDCDVDFVLYQDDNDPGGTLFWYAEALKPKTRKDIIGCSVDSKEEALEQCIGEYRWYVFNTKQSEEIDKKYQEWLKTI